MPWCDIYITVPEVGRTDQNMRETINCGCFPKLVYFLGYINILNWRYTKNNALCNSVYGFLTKYCTTGVILRLLTLILNDSKYFVLVTVIPYWKKQSISSQWRSFLTEGGKGFRLSDSHSLLSDASLFYWFFPNFMTDLSEIQYDMIYIYIYI
jgi:hypothetical protein